MNYRLLGAMMIVASSASAGAYRTYLPKAVDCSAESKNIAERLTKVTGAKVKSVLCKPFDTTDPMAPAEFDENVVTVVYEGAKSLDSRTSYLGFTYDVGSIKIGNLAGVYSSVADCESDLSSQRKTFTDQSGKEAVNVSCEPAESIGEFVIRFDPFAGIQQEMQVFNTGAIDSDVIGANDVAQIANMIRSSGHTVTKITNNLIFYYASNTHPLDLSVNLAGTLASDAQCQQQKQKLTQLLPADALVVCTSGMSNGLNVVAKRSLKFATSTLAGDYATFAECLAEEASRGPRAFCVYEGRSMAAPYAIRLATH